MKHTYRMNVMRGSWLVDDLSTRTLGIYYPIITWARDLKTTCMIEARDTYQQIVIFEERKRKKKSRIIYTLLSYFTFGCICIVFDCYPSSKRNVEVAWGEISMPNQFERFISWWWKTCLLWQKKKSFKIVQTLVWWIYDAI